MAEITAHRWRFFRAGGFDQVRLTSGADLLALEHLDQKFWAALACPARGTEFDSKTLDLIDTDKDGRVRAPEVIAAVKWAAALLKDPGEILQGAASLPLTSINDSAPEGRQILSSARQILVNLGKRDATAISIEDVADTVRIFAATHFNGDGIIPPESAEDDATGAVIQEMVTCVGSATDRGGKAGVKQPHVDQFFAELQSFSEWWKRAEDDRAILPLGDRTTAAAAALRAVRAKVDDYFARCRLAAFDSRALPALNRLESEYLAVGAQELSFSVQEASAFPLARIEPGRALPLRTGLNPAWAGPLAELDRQVIQPLLGERDAVTETEWSALVATFVPFDKWEDGKTGAAVERLGLARVREILAGPTREGVTALIAKDQALEPEANAIAAVEKLGRFYRDLHTLLVNFVSFEDFYSRRRKAVFQAGTLYLDGRSCDLCVRVEDAGRHAALAGLARTFLAYCECVRTGGEKMTIAAAFTGGDSDYLMVGRNGLFYDRKGRDWDATITKIIENPISIQQAFWAPYKKLVRLIEEQVAKRAASAQSVADAKLTTVATAAVTADKTKPELRKMDVGTVAALGVAFGALGTAFATLAGYITGLLALPFWRICLALIGLLFLVSGPSMLIAWLKLRQRNLGPILDANGWAVNGRVIMNVPFGGSLTSVGKLPPGAQTVLDDPFGEKPRTWTKLLLAAVVICFLYSFLNSQGFVYDWAGGKWGEQKVKRPETNSPPRQATSTNAALLPLPLPGPAN